METFVLMTKLSPELLGDPRGREAAGKAWLKKVAHSIFVDELKKILTEKRGGKNRAQERQTIRSCRWH